MYALKMLIPALYLSQFFHLIFEIHAKTVQSISSIQKNSFVVNQYFRNGGGKERKLPLDNQKTQHHEQLAKTEMAYY